MANYAKKEININPTSMIADLICGEISWPVKLGLTILLIIIIVLLIPIVPFVFITYYAFYGTYGIMPLIKSINKSM
jgi:hypothetical protein